jgi:Fe2+ or Zn2+ uptake regulation protein
MLLGVSALNQCQHIDRKLPTLARHILRYLREHPEAQDTIEGITVWWVSERVIKQWLPQVRNALSALIARGYLEKHTQADGRMLYRLRNRLPPDH